MKTTQLLSLLFVAISFPLWADGPADNIPAKVRRVPPPGIVLTAADRQELTERLKAFEAEIEKARAELKGRPALLDLMPDVLIFHHAVRFALDYNEFFKPGEIAVGKNLLNLGETRLQQLRAGKPAWTTATGLVVRGYVSKIDGSVQPYGLLVPDSYRPGAPYSHRLDLWFHGRGELLSELNFLDGRLKSPGEFTPPHAFVLHPYGRYCNANHFAGEIDTLEALDHVVRHYPIDDNRLVVRGFSMGGAACWNYAVHYAWKWAAAAPGAGFSETPDFLKVFQKEDFQPTWYEKKLLHWYDCTDWAENLFHCPTVAYSGEKDSQKQASDIMAIALGKVNLPLVHIIGAGAGHSYTPVAKAEINRRIDSIVAKGRDPLPHRLRFTTYTLRYPRMHWLTVEGMERHWEKAAVEAKILGPEKVAVKTTNVAAFTLHMPPGYCPLENQAKIAIDGREINAPPIQSDRSWTAHFRKTDQGWSAVKSLDDGKLRKRPGLQGPIDDAFMDRFLMVKPTGQPLNAKVGEWVLGEMNHAIEHWRGQFRGIAPQTNDRNLNEADIASSNLILWGDPSSNPVMAKVVEKLPITWNAKTLRVGQKTYDPAHHVPALIFPNPLNPKKYVVLNSGFTYREYDYLNNARQVPKLPDWAILDISQPATSQRPAGIVEAGFFNEFWEWK